LPEVTVPEPSSFLLLATPVAGFVLLRRRSDFVRPREDTGIDAFPHLSGVACVGVAARDQ
jgi:hypothetical protein